MTYVTAVRFSLQIIFSLFLLFSSTVASAENETAADTEAKQESQLVSAVRQYGRKMNRADAQALEQSLKAAPEDLTARAKLLGYYFYRGLKLDGAQATIKARRRHITWLIQHHPASRLSGVPEATIDPAGHPLADRVGYETASSMWRALADREDAAPQTMNNAFNFLRLTDKPEAEKIARRANNPYLLGELYAMGVLRVSMMNQNGLVVSTGSSREDDKYAEHAIQALRTSEDMGVIDSAAAFLIMRGSIVQIMARRTGKTIEPEPVAFAGELLERCDDCQSKSLYYKISGMMSQSPAEKKKLAQQELAQLEKDTSKKKPLKPEKSSGLSLGELSDYTEVAFNAGEYARAADYANQIVSKVEGHTLDGMYGMAAHTAHIVLGRIALKKGDVKGAGEQLLAAGDVTGGATLQSFGPNMALAKGLLERGERKVVIAYLNRCKRFWDRGQSRLTEWIETIENGGMPNFGPNLVY